MKLYGKQVLMMVADGVEYTALLKIKAGFEQEQATVLLTTPYEFLTVETVIEGQFGPTVPIDVPLDAVIPEQFHALVIPDGILHADLLARDARTRQIVQAFHELRRPIIASGEAAWVLEESGILTNHILVRDLVPLDVFIDRSVELVLDGGSASGYAVNPSKMPREALC